MALSAFGVHHEGVSKGFGQLKTLRLKSPGTRNPLATKPANQFASAAQRNSQHYGNRGMNNSLNSIATSSTGEQLRNASASYRWAAGQKSRAGQLNNAARI